MEEYKIGDKVEIIKHQLSGCDTRDCPSFNRNMEKFTGQIATIQMSASIYFRIDIDDNNWSWWPCMFVPFDKAKNWFYNVATKTTSERRANG